MSIAAYRKKIRIAPYDPATGAANLAMRPDGTSGWCELPTESPSLNFGNGLVDDTNLKTNDGYRTRLYTLADWSVPCDSNYASDDDGLQCIRTAIFGRQKLVVQYLPEGEDNLSSGLQGVCLVENFNLGGDVGSKEMSGINLQGCGKLAAANATGDMS